MGRNTLRQEFDYLTSRIFSEAPCTMENYDRYCFLKKKSDKGKI